MITGSIRSVSITPVQAGQTLQATVDYVATNPGALYWKTWLVAFSYGMSLQKMLDETREIGEDGGRVKTYSLATMPSNTVSISFFLFASDQASASWDWNRFLAWLNYGASLPDGVEYLGSNYQTAAPADPPLPNSEFRNLTVLSASSPVDVGGNCVVTCRWEYRGPQIIKTLYAAIGNNGTFGFDEILNASEGLVIPESAAWTVMTGSVSIPITGALDPEDSPYDVYAKLTGTANDLISPVRNNIIAMAGPIIPDPEYRGLSITGYDASVEPGNYCNVQVAFQYRGPAGAKTLYAAIGNKGAFGFDEILHASKLLSIPESADWRNISASVQIYIDNGIDPEDSPYDLYAKLTGTGNDVSTGALENIITIIGQTPVPDAEFRNLSVTNVTSPVIQGGQCTVQVRFEYRGPTITKTLYAAIGNNGWLGFDEIVNGSVAINIQEALDWEYKTAQVQVPVTSAVNSDDSPYDVYAKLTGAANDITSAPLENVITVEGGGYDDPEFQQITVKSVTSPVQIGGTCWIKVGFQYRGPAITKTLYAAIGNSGLFGFDEILHASGDINLPAAAEWTPIESEIAIAITEALNPDDSPYDVYAKLTGPGNDLISSAKIDAVEVQEGTGSGGITGAITAIDPLTFEIAAPIEILVDYNAYCDDAALQVTGWKTRVSIELSGLTDSVEQNHVGQEASVAGAVLAPGNMPNQKLTGRVVLEGQGEGDWQELYAKAITVSPPGSGSGEGGTPGIAWAIAGGLILLAAGSGSSKKKPQKRTTSKSK